MLDTYSVLKSACMSSTLEDIVLKSPHYVIFLTLHALYLTSYFAHIFVLVKMRTLSFYKQTMQKSMSVTDTLKRRRYTSAALNQPV